MSCNMFFATYIDKVFPEYEEIFTFYYKTFDEVKDSCIFVIDTNVLLVPFFTSKKSLTDIKKIYKKLKSKNRVFIPARVAQEFANNRGEKIKEIYRSIFNSIDKLNNSNFSLGNFPILEDNTDYLRIKELDHEINKLKVEYKEKLDNISNHVRTWNWNDPVSKFYREFWTKELIVDVKKDKKDIIEDFEFKSVYKVAPGYKDKDKPDDGIGDLIIWQTILEIGKEKKKDVVFVTNEEKNDWFYREAKTPLYPKFELFDEFRRESNGNSINLINFEDFLTSQNAEKETIDEVKVLYAETGYLIIDTNTFLQELKIAQNKNRFVSSKYFVENVLANKNYDIGSSWQKFYELKEQGVIELYTHTDPEGTFMPISAVRIKDNQII